MNEYSLKKILSETVFNHVFESFVIQKYEEKLVRPPIYLSLGTEHIPPTLKYAFTDFGLSLKDFAIFPQHRCHSYYLSFAGDPLALALELCGHPKGCNGGMGGSASVSNNSTANLFGHSGLLGDQVPIATGYCFASRKPTIVVLGDAAAEEDYALGAIGFAVTKKIPVLFICEDNDLSILTPKKIRRSWEIASVAKGFGAESFSIKDDPEVLFEIVQSFLKQPKPMLINIECQRHRWHAGAGIDSEPAWNSYINLLEKCKNIFGENFVQNVVQDKTKKNELVWSEATDEIKRYH